MVKYIKYIVFCIFIGVTACVFDEGNTPDSFDVYMEMPNSNVDNLRDTCTLTQHPKDNNLSCRLNVRLTNPFILKRSDKNNGQTATVDHIVLDLKLVKTGDDFKYLLKIVSVPEPFYISTSFGEKEGKIFSYQQLQNGLKIPLATPPEALDHTATLFGDAIILMPPPANESLILRVDPKS